MNKIYTNKKIICLFLAPAFLIFVMLAAVPIIMAIYFSAFDWPGIQGIPLEFVGVQNFIKLFRYKEFYKAFVNSLEFVLFGMLIQMPIGYGLALLLCSYPKGYRLFKTSFFLPYILPMTATSLVWSFIYGANDRGVLNIFLKHIGLENLSTAWLTNTNTALICVIIAYCWAGFGYHMTIAFASITGLPDDVLESAELDGAIGIKKVFYIILPMIKECIKTSVVLLLIGGVQVFDIIYIMTGGGPNGLTNTPATLLYNEAFKYSHYGMGSAVSVFIFIISVSLSIISLKIMNRGNVE